MYIVQWIVHVHCSVIHTSNNLSYVYASQYWKETKMPSLMHQKYRYWYTKYITIVKVSNTPVYPLNYCFSNYYGDNVRPRCWWKCRDVHCATSLGPMHLGLIYYLRPPLLYKYCTKMIDVLVYKISVIYCLTPLLVAFTYYR